MNAEDYNLLTYQARYREEAGESPESFIFNAAWPFRCIDGHNRTLRVNGEKVCHDCGAGVP